MATVTPNWTDNISVLATQLLARNAVVSANLDLRTKYGAYLFLRVGRTGTAALTNGIVARVYRNLNPSGAITDATRVRHPAGLPGLGPGFSAAASSTTVNADVAAGATTLNVASSAGFAVEDFILIGGGTAREEWARVARVTDATHLLLDAPVQFAHTAVQADPVLNKADIYPPVWLPGGSEYTVVFDYGDDAAGDSVRVEAKAQTFDSEGSVA